MHAPLSFNSRQSSPFKNSAVCASSPGRMPAYTSATLRTEVVRECPSRSRFASRLRRLFRPRKTSIKTEVSRRIFMQSTISGAWTCGIHSAAVVCAPRMQHPSRVRDDLVPSSLRALLQGSAIVFDVGLLHEPSPRGKRCVHGVPQGHQFPARGLREEVYACALFAWPSWIHYECAIKVCRRKA